MSRSSRAIHIFVGATTLALCALQSVWAEAKPSARVEQADNHASITHASRAAAPETESSIAESSITESSITEASATEIPALPAAELRAKHETTILTDDLSTKTDTELTALTAQWGSLGAGERRRLLAEVRSRMVVNQKTRRPIGVRVQRRYGRVVRKPDGSVVVQTRVVQLTPRTLTPRTLTSKSLTPRTLTSKTGDTALRSRITFGFGFERRSKSQPQQREVVTLPQVQSSPPAVTVNQQTTPVKEP